MLTTKLSAALLLWMPVAVWAQEQAQPDAPVEVVNRGFVWLFFAVFFGLIVYFFVLVYRNEKRRKAEEADGAETSQAISTRDDSTPLGSARSPATPQAD